MTQPKTTSETTDSAASTTEAAPVAQTGSQAELNPQNGSLVPAQPTIPQPASAAVRFGLLAKFLNRRNRVHNTGNAQAQNEWMQKHGGNGSAVIQQSDDALAVSDGTTVVSGNYRKRFVKWIKEVTFDPYCDSFYYWTCAITFAFIYNLVFIIARQVFTDLIGPTSIYLCKKVENLPGGGRTTIVECDYDLLTDMKEMPTTKPYPDSGWSKHYVVRIIWIIADMVFDGIYLIDFFVNTRMGYLEQGLIVKDIAKIHKRYYASREFKIDLMSMIPLDYIIGWPTPIFKGIPFIRCFRLLRVSRFKDWLERTETRSSMPNAFRVLVVVFYIVIIIHWNACLYFWISELIGLGTDNWVYGHLNKQSLPDGVTDTLVRRYVYSFYWSTLILTTIGEVPSPVRNVEYVFVTLDLMCGVLIFATIVGNVGSMISNMSAARTEFQNKMDGIKQYMELRKVSKQLEMRVIKWFDYLWANKQSLSDQQVLKVLPDKLQAEIAMQVHFETLRKVRIFQDCESGLLAELVLKLQLQVFSPGDYICKKGDIGREMYIVKRGRLNVVSDAGDRVFAVLSEGHVFGELSILNIAGSKNGNRRTANVQSVGYTDLFVLNKNDLWNALREYPEARKLLLAKGRELLRKDDLLNDDAPEEQESVEDIAVHLNTSVRVLQTRMARLIAEHSSTEAKLLRRIELLETHLSRYKTIARRQKSMQGASLDGGGGNGDEFAERRAPRLRHAKTLDLSSGNETDKMLK